MKDNEYQCSKCGGVFEKGWSDEEAQEEAEKLWSEEDLKDVALVCDDCFEELLGGTIDDQIGKMKGES